MVDPLETIVAIATPRGGGARGILRLSGPKAWQIVGRSFDSPLAKSAGYAGPRAIAGRLSLPSLTAPLPAILLLSQEPRSFTGQDLVEVHTLGSPPILELALSTFVARGARPALPGEFTMRAFLSGKLDLTEAEAILGLIDATNSRQAAVALRQMAGGIARPIGLLRNRLLDLLAELEAGLDFDEEDLELIDRCELRVALETALTQLQELGGQMEDRVLSVDRRRVVLIGPPNVGKSSLFNALLGRDAALVSQAAGTTRDYLVGELQLTHCSIELADTAGIEETDNAISEQAKRFREQVVGDAELVLCCVNSSGESAPAVPPELLCQPGRMLVIHTKTDLLRERPRCVEREAWGDGKPVPIENQKARIKDPPAIPVSAHTGAGLAELRQAIENWVRSFSEAETAVVACTAARCRQAIAGAQAATARALAAVNSAAGDDLIALELRLALDELSQVVGAVYTDDILDRIFSRFCIGK